MIDPYVLDDQDSIEMYNEKNTLVSNQSRVYKGGGWRDMPYWMSPGSRRFLNENNSADDIGFRCAMIRMGSPTGVAAKKKKK
jgi:formylglycine-generating enzyme required for sulfatase activity